MAEALKGFTVAAPDCFADLPGVHFRALHPLTQRGLGQSEIHATCATVRSPTWQRRTASALNPGVNERRFLRDCRFDMEHSWRIFAPFGVSTEPGEDQQRRSARMV